MKEEARSNTNIKFRNRSNKNNISTDNESTWERHAQEKAKKSISQPERHLNMIQNMKEYKSELEKQIRWHEKIRK